MVEGFNPIRYSVIEDKNPREIVMLVGDGCKWRKCRFCDYHLDSSKDIEANFQLNKQVLSNVTGKFGELEVINSGSFVDLDKKTIELIKQICLKKGIKEIHFECHYMHKDDVQNFKNSFLNKWRKCRFCDYHLDSSKDIEANFQLNKQVLSNVTGKFGELEVINSGSFVDLDKKTIELIKQICLKKGIKEIHFECHYMHKDDVQNFKNSFLNIGIKPIIKLGLETFDYDLREKVLVKGIEEKNPEVIANYFDEINLLQGISGQTKESMISDIETGLKYFSRICVNIMVENQMPIKPDKKVIEQFMEYVYPLYKDNDRVDILLNNTDFGVG